MGHGTDVLALRHYLGVIRRGWWIIVLTAALTTTVAALLSMRQETTYRASSAVFLGARNPAFLFSGIPEPYVDAERYLQNQATIARLPDVAELAVKDADIPGYAAARLLGSSSVTAASDADVLSFSVSDPDPVVATEIATSYARAYTRYKQLADTRTIAETRGRYQQQIAELEKAGERGSTRNRPPSEVHTKKMKQIN